MSIDGPAPEGSRGALVASASRTPAGTCMAALHTRDLLSDCIGAGAEWLTAAQAASPEAAAAIASAAARSSNEHSTGGFRAGDGTSAWLAAPVGSSAAAELFQLKPLPEGPGPQELQVLDAAPEPSESSALSLAAAAAAAAPTEPPRPDSVASVALSSPDAMPLPYLPAAASDDAAGGETARQEAGAPTAEAEAAAQHSSAEPTFGGSGSQQQQMSAAASQQQQLRQLHINAAFEPGRDDAEQGEGSSSDSPAVQLARLLAFPLTPDQPVYEGGVEVGTVCSGGSGGPAHITPGTSPAQPHGGPHATAANALPVRNLEQQLLAETLQAQVAALQAEAGELREALAVAEANAGAYAEEAQLLRGAAAAAEERQAMAQARQAQAQAALAAAVREQQHAQQVAEAAAEARWEAEQREATLQEQLELLALERREAAAAADGSGYSALLTTAAEPGAGNALMAEVALLRRQLESVAASKRQLADALAAQREQTAALHARLSAAAAAAERLAAVHAHQLAEVTAGAAARCRTLEQHNQLLAAHAAALQAQLTEERAAAAGAIAGAAQQAAHLVAAAEQAQSVDLADLHRQLHAEREARCEQESLADAAAQQVTQQAAAFSEALLQQQAAAVHWRRQAEQLAGQLAAASGAEADIKTALQVGFGLVNGWPDGGGLP